MNRFSGACRDGVSLHWLRIDAIRLFPPRVLVRKTAKEGSGMKINTMYRSIMDPSQNPLSRLLDLEQPPGSGPT